MGCSVTMSLDERCLGDRKARFLSIIELTWLIAAEPEFSRICFQSVPTEGR